MYYWVNQGKTYFQESEGGYLWAPIKDINGRSLFHWDNMKKLVPNDLIFNYKKGYLVGYCIVKSKSYFHPQPKGFEMDFDWQNEGFMVDAEYYTFKKKISIISVYNLIKELLPEKYSPITGKNKIKANEGYLYELSQEIGVKLRKLTNISFEDQDVNKSFLDSLEFLEETSRKRLVTTRVGQGLYRRRILNRWKYKCAVSGLGITNILIASHIVPWRESNDKEKLDVDNGILLSPVYDALFDRYYISFNDNGDIVLSNNIKKSEFLKIGVNGNEKINNLSKGNIEYLKRHRKKLLK